VVVKVGSRSLAQGDEAFARLAGAVATFAGASRRSVVLVSSGAIALGSAHLGFGRRPRDMAKLQAAAAAGQSLLMQRWADAFGVHGRKVAQVLLTHADLAGRSRVANARATLLELLDLGVVPIINENDALAVDEIRFGDNDELAAMVAPLVEGELLLLLSDVEGLLDEQGRRVPLVALVDDRLRQLAGASRSGVGRGGMESKLEAARRATLAGVHVVIASAAEPDVVARVAAGHDVGTLLPAVTRRLRARKHWIAYTLRPRGAAIVDDGAADAVVRHGRSILCVGVLGVRGSFVAGDAIAIVTPAGHEIARGLARLSALEAARFARAEADESELLVHRDDLVVLA
jgi:glutamate 5-kinase